MKLVWTDIYAVLDALDANDTPDVKLFVIYMESYTDFLEASPESKFKMQIIHRFSNVVAEQIKEWRE